MRAADNDPEFIDLREIVVEHRTEIFRFARSLTHCNADAEDLAQTAVVRALQRGSLSCSPEQAKWYVMRIVRNLATDAARARNRVAIEPYAVVPDVSTDDSLPEDLALRADEAAFPRPAFAELPLQHREVLRLRFLEELGYDKVAQYLGVTEHAARQRVYRALQALRAAMRLRPT